jgi:hypothetical protein
MKKSRILKHVGAVALVGALLIGVVSAQTGPAAGGVSGLAGLLRDSLYEEEANRDLTKAAAGLPGRPRMICVPRRAIRSGLPGLIATRQNASSAPSSASAGRTRS